MKKIVKLTESDLTDLIGKVIEEQNKQWFGDGPGPGVKKTNTFSILTTMDGSLFENGISKIDVNSTQFKKGVDALKRVSQNKKNVEVKVQGGASAVGSGSGFDNQSLAKKRAENFISQVQGMFPNVKFTASAKVGTATKKNSPEARAEQYVKLFIPEDMTQSYITPAIDKTAVKMQPISPKFPEAGKTEMVTKCFMIPLALEKDIVRLIQKNGGQVKS